MTDTGSAKSNGDARFVQGSTMRHVVVMTFTSAIGLMTLFLVDFADMYFLSLLGEENLAAAVGYAGTVLFFTTSICIGLAIAAAALVSRAIGGGDTEAARRLSTNVLLFGIAVTVVLAAIIWIECPLILSMLGAEGRTHDLALSYLRILIPTMPILSIAITGGAILRALGDAKRAMYSTLIGGLVNAALDPLLIFTFALGIEGAAWASVAARLAIVVVALNGVIRVHGFLGAANLAGLTGDIGAISRIAVPAMATNIATPVGNGYVTASIAEFGDGAVAGMAIIGRVMPVAFAVVFALSGAIGPIIGQNFGAVRFDRVRRGFTDAHIFTAVYVALVSLILFLLQDHISALFMASADAAALISLFCTWIVASFLFNGALFVSNAAFNNLGSPHVSTLFNWGKATIGTIPLVWAGGLLYGAPGVLIGQAVGSVLFGIAAVAVAYRLIGGLDIRNQAETVPEPLMPEVPPWPQSSNRCIDL